MNYSLISEYYQVHFVLLRLPNFLFYQNEPPSVNEKTPRISSAPSIGSTRQRISSARSRRKLSQQHKSSTSSNLSEELMIEQIYTNELINVSGTHNTGVFRTLPKILDRKYLRKQLTAFILDLRQGSEYVSGILYRSNVFVIPVTRI